MTRSDVGAAYPGYGANHGYDATVTAAKGTHTVCTYAINTLSGTTNPVLKTPCPTVTVPTGQVTGTWQTA